MPFDLSSVVTDPDLAQAFTIVRSTGGQWVAGGFQNATTNIPATGVIAPASDEALEMVPQGDRVTGSLMVFTDVQMNPTLAAIDSTGEVSDKIVWNGDTYRVQAVGPWKDYGFWTAIMVRIAGN